MRKIKYGVCVDNKDPYNAGRIRVLIDKEERDRFINNTHAKSIIDEIDSQNRNAYIKWELATDRFTSDPYVVNPLLPKHLNITPKIGEAVKLLLFDEGANSYMEYIGPEISNKNKTSFELYEEGRGFTDVRLRNPTRFNFEQYIYPNQNHIAIIGRDNSDLIFGNNEVVLRSGFRTLDGLRKSDKFSLFQIEKYPTKKIVTTEERIINTTPRAVINYVVEYEVITQANEIRILINIYPTDTILNTRNYDESVSYLTDVNDPVITISASSKSRDKLLTFINNLLSNLDNNILELQAFTTVTENGITYFAEDFRPPINGEDQVGERLFTISLYAFRINPNQLITDSNYKFFLESRPNQLRPLNKAPQQSVEVSEVEVLEDLENTEQTAAYLLSDITLLLSSQTDPTLSNQVTHYGFTQEKLNTVLLRQTEPMVRGKKLAKILLRILDVIDIHGHSTDGPATISENVKEELKAMKNELNTILNDDMNNSSDLVNENLRIN